MSLIRLIAERKDLKKEKEGYNPTTLYKEKRGLNRWIV